MKISPSAHSDGGFTLIEVVISASIMALILGASYACLNSGLISQKLVESRLEATQNARAVMTRITADLRSACPLSKDYDFLGIDRTMGEAEADNVDFGTHNYHPRRPGESDFAEMSYFLRKDERTGKFTLWRRVDASPDDQPLAGGRQEEIARGLRGLRFEYYDGFDWYDEWGDPTGKKKKSTSMLTPPNLTGLPEAVRVTIWCDPHPETLVKEDEDPPLMFQTVARLNLASVSAKRSSSTSSSSSGSTQNGNQNPNTPTPGAEAGGIQ